MKKTSLTKRSPRRASGLGRSREEAVQFLVRKAHEKNVKFIRIWFTDILGSLKSFAITIDNLDKALREGVGFDGSSIESFARAEEHDMIAIPDIKTFRVLPWRPQENAVARMFADIVHMDGRPFEGDPRYCLRRNLRMAARSGFTFYVGPEIEFFYFKTPSQPEPLDEGGYFDLTPLDAGSDLRRETVLALEEMGIEVHSSHHEGAPSQHEIDLRYRDALTMADNTMTYRLVVKEIALKHNVYATFMPKPIEGENGSGMHVHQSLFSTRPSLFARGFSRNSKKREPAEANVFYDPRDRMRLSAFARHYVAGLLQHAREIALVTNQWTNSYKRLVAGYEAPTSVIWAQRNPSALVRIPLYKEGNPQAMRCELRSPDPACNPYLAFSVMLAAGLDGIRHKMKLPDPREENIFALSAQEKGRQGIESLPASLGEAIEISAGSGFLKETLGEHILTSLIENKKIEWDAYRRHISPFELKKHLATL